MRLILNNTRYSLFRYIFCFIAYSLFASHNYVLCSDKENIQDQLLLLTKEIRNKIKQIYPINLLFDKARNQADSEMAISKLKIFTVKLLDAMLQDRILTDKEFTLLQSNNKISFINVTRFAPNQDGFTTRMANKETLNTVKKALEEYLQLTKNTITFVIFDEMFWSQEKPLKDKSNDDSEVTKEKIDKMIKDISAKNKNVFFVVNYLYESDIEDGNEENNLRKCFYNYIHEDAMVLSFSVMDVLQLSGLTKDGQSYNFVLNCILNRILNRIINNSNCIQINDMLDKLYDCTINSKSQKLQNQTIIIHNRKELITHNKYGYFNEYNDGIISRSHIYVHGDGYNHKGSCYGEEQNTSQYIKDNLGIAICLDLNLGKNKNNKFYASEESMQQEKILIVQSNHIEIFDDLNKNNLPDNTIISHSDKNLLKSRYNDRCNSVECSAGFNFLQFKVNNQIIKLLNTTIGDTYICDKDNDYVNITLEVVDLQCCL